MPRILVFNPPVGNLSSAVNVLAHVGPNGPNNPDDVRVVQRLLGMMRSKAATRIGVPQVTGNYDAATGFWIYDTQFFGKTNGHPNTVVDGVVSPAHGALYSPGAAWTIVLFNSFAKRDSPTEYAQFVAQMSS